MDLPKSCSLRVDVEPLDGYNVKVTTRRGELIVHQSLHPRDLLFERIETLFGNLLRQDVNKLVAEMRQYQKHIERNQD